MRRDTQALATVLGLMVIGVTSMGVTGRSKAAPVSAQSQAATSQGPTVGSTFKNIHVLTDLNDQSPDQLYNAMQFMAGSLSVSCNYCHISEHGQFESDGNKRKLTAREMIKMTRAINATSFEGKQVVTCNTCHQGRTRPNGMPSPWYKSEEQIAEYNRAVAENPPATLSPAKLATNAADSPALPSVDEVMERYRRAVGESELKSLRLTGTYTAAVSGDATPVPFEADFGLPDQILISQGAAGPGACDIVNKDRGWRTTSAGTTELPAGQIAGVRYRSQELLPVKYQTATAPRKVAGAQMIDGKSYWVVEWHSPVGTGKLFFDQSSGLLYKFRAEIPTPFGTRVDERTFEDYRTVNGVKLAFLITEHYMEDEGIYKVSKAETNVAFDPATFTAGEVKQK